MIRRESLTARPRSIPRVLPWIGAVLVTIGLLSIVAVVAQSEIKPATPPVAVAGTAPVQPRLNARAQIEPAHQAKVGTLTGGVVATLSVQVGQRVDEQQEIARVRSAAGTEVLTAPWAGTVTGLPIQVGDTVLAGSTIAYLADLRRLQVETTDVDEFIIARIHAGQPVTLTVDALDRREYSGVVRTVGLQQQPNASGDEAYPVVIDLNDSTPDLRPGMSARVYFQP